MRVHRRRRATSYAAAIPMRPSGSGGVSQAPIRSRPIQPLGLEQDEGGESTRLFATQMDDMGVVPCRRGNLQLHGRARRIALYLNFPCEFVCQSHAVALLA